MTNPTEILSAAAACADDLASGTLSQGAFYLELENIALHLKRLDRLKPADFSGTGAGMLYARVAARTFRQIQSDDLWNPQLARVAADTLYRALDLV